MVVTKFNRTRDLLPISSMNAVATVCSTLWVMAFCPPIAPNTPTKTSAPLVAVLRRTFRIDESGDQVRVFDRVPQILKDRDDAGEHDLLGRFEFSCLDALNFQRGHGRFLLLDCASGKGETDGGQREPYFGQKHVHVVFLRMDQRGR